jgi:hypothetical protein
MSYAGPKYQGNAKTKLFAGIDQRDMRQTGFLFEVSCLSYKNILITLIYQ